MKNRVKYFCLVLGLVLITVRSDYVTIISVDDQNYGLKAQCLSVGADGTVIKNIVTVSTNCDFTTLDPLSKGVIFITIPTVGTNDTAFANIITPNANLIYSCEITGTNTVNLYAANITTNSVNPWTTGVKITVIQY